MRRADLIVAMAALVATLVGACSSSPAGTALLLRLSYDDAWSLSRLDIEARERVQSARTARELLVRVPDGWAGAPLTVDVWGHRGDTRYAHGQVTLTPVLDQTVTADVALSRMPCGAWCTPGSTSCQGDTVVVCEQRDDDGCFEWSDPVACSPDAPYCSFGVCSDTCVDECGDGDTRCAGPEGLQLCGSADSDPCNDWLPAVACGDGDTCSNGACSATCQDECAAGTKECLGAGTVTCGDLDGDGCLEWSPITDCQDGQSCTNGVCAAGCTDECSASSCSGLNFTACGQFDLDSCLDRSPGMSCVPSNACLEGSCAPATGCASAPKVCDMPPEAECINAGTLRTYAAQGTCSAGACDYMPTDIACPNCPACDACEGVTCNMPPAPTACYQPSGTCTDGSCSYAFKNNATCNDNDACTLNDTCASGVCSGTPKACTAPPPAMCLNTTTLRTYAPTGTCSAGTCAYGHTDSTCPNGCNAGACNAPRRADLIYVTKSSSLGVQVGLSSGSAFAAAVKWNYFVASDSEVPRFHFADVDGDGKDDLIYVTKSSSLGVQVGLSSGSAFATLVKWNDFVASDSEAPRFHFADVNGDGKADLIYVTKSSSLGVQVGLSSGSAFATLVKWNDFVASDSEVPRFHFADVNGDGKADLIYVTKSSSLGVQVGLSSGSAFATLVKWNDFVASDSEVPRFHFADVNGDGKADLIYVTKSSSLGVQVGLSSGSAFATRLKWNDFVASDSEVPGFHFADVNGDGKADLIFVTNSSNLGVQVGLSSGSAFATRLKWNGLTASTSEAPRFHFADVNGM